MRRHRQMRAPLPFAVTRSVLLRPLSPPDHHPALTFSFSPHPPSPRPPAPSLSHSQGTFVPSTKNRIRSVERTLQRKGHLLPDEVRAHTCVFERCAQSADLHTCTGGYAHASWCWMRGACCCAGARGDAGQARDAQGRVPRVFTGGKGKDHGHAVCCPTETPETPKYLGTADCLPGSHARWLPKRGSHGSVASQASEATVKKVRGFGGVGHAAFAEGTLGSHPAFPQAALIFCKPSAKRGVPSVVS